MFNPYSGNIPFFYHPISYDCQINPFSPFLKNPVINPTMNQFFAPMMQPELNPLWNPYLSPFCNHPICFPLIAPVCSWMSQYMPESWINPLSHPNMLGILAPSFIYAPIQEFQRQVINTFAPWLNPAQQWQQYMFSNFGLSDSSWKNNPFVQTAQQWPNYYQFTAWPNLSSDKK